MFGQSALVQPEAIQTARTSFKHPYGLEMGLFNTETKDAQARRKKKQICLYSTCKNPWHPFLRIPMVNHMAAKSAEYSSPRATTTMNPSLHPSDLYVAMLCCAVLPQKNTIIKSFISSPYFHSITIPRHLVERITLLGRPHC